MVLLTSSGWEDRGLRVHHASTGAELLALSRVKGGSFSPDGRRIVTLRGEKAVLWDSATGLEVASFKVSTPFSDPFPQAVMFSPDGRHIIATGQTAAGLWDADRGQLVFLLPGGGLDCCRGRPLAVSPDGRFLATALGDLAVQIWDAATGQPLRALRGHKEAVTSAGFSPDGGRLVTGGDDRAAKVWDVQTGREVLSLEGHRSSVRSAVFFPDGHRVVTCSWDGTVRIWDAYRE